ncbi:GNAT family N-acetyltransferase [Geothrix campi]|uniref:GNAT family N-acetyltransferase n=1 Tax=Geothrix campi TaxID=2966450 RepID=UPI00214741C1|nr:GNAT family N-acetyltransferase [Geothrix sp. SG10]
MNTVQIAQVTTLQESELGELVIESEVEGFGFVSRLRDEWYSSRNRFDQPGEAFFTARVQGQLVGVCGLSRDPYSVQAGVGRVRRLYVRKEFRRLGVGQQLVQAVVEVARKHFTLLSLRTDNPIASRFYERQGFHPISRLESCTHLLSLVAP